MDKNIYFKIDAYHQLPMMERKVIDSFVCHCFQEKIIRPIHSKMLGFQSVRMYVDEKILIGYAGYVILYSDVYHKTFAPVSCFCIDPLYQRHGYGSKLLRYIEQHFAKQDNIYFSLFTCESSKLSFYIKHSDWRIVPLILTSKQYHSRVLGLSVLFQSFDSNFTLQNLMDQTDRIDLNLPDDIFI